MEFQTLLARIREHLKQQKINNAKIMERSVYSGYYCFAKNGYDSGFLTEIEWQIYNHWFNYLVTTKCTPPSGFIYLKVDPEVSFARVKKRNRNAETNLSLDYLKQINYYHDQFLINKKNLIPSLQKVPVLVIDCNEEFEKNIKQQNKHFKKLKEFISPNTNIQTNPKKSLFL